ncbi:MAG: M48 family metallopeptidase, partial [Gammaproteobacteria bacterium]
MSAEVTADTAFPADYRLKVAGMIVLGYGYVLGVVLLAVGLLAGVGVLVAKGGAALLVFAKLAKFAWPLAIAVPFLVRSVFVRIPKPEGLYLKGVEKRAVLEFIEPVRAEAGGPRVRHVVLGTSMNAAVQQVPWFGVFGPSTNYLVLGVPLLCAMSEDELKAVVAHEFGHLSRAHGSLGAWSYRLDETLSRVVATLREKTGSRLNSWYFFFLRWFYPTFDELSFALRRAQEFEADRLAASAVGSQVVGDALCRLHYVEPTYERYWQTVWQDARRQDAPAGVSPWSGLARGLADNVEPAAGRR